MQFLIIGYYVGNFFGKKDSWYESKKDLTFLSEKEIRLLFNDFDIIKFNEFETDANLCSGEKKHWHIYDIMARKKNLHKLPENN